MRKSYIGNIPNPHVRDFQRKKVYQAEEQCSFWNIASVLDIHQIEMLVKLISEWAEVPRPEIIEDGHQMVFATQDSIVLPYPASKTLPYILHEMSHVINYNSKNADHHGVYFSETYLSVVREFIGVDASLELQQSFEKHKVKYLPDLNNNPLHKTGERLKKLGISVVYF